VDDDCLIFNEYPLDPFLVPRRTSSSWFENSCASGLGWGLGAALGAKIALPDKTIIVTLGDGSYLFNTPLSAHHVAASYSLPIIIIVFNDSAWSTIKKSVKGSHPKGHSVKNNKFILCDFDINMKYETICEASGGIGMRVDKPTDIENALKEAIKITKEQKKHVLINFIVERDG
jgi:acetolactate synthase I/II/III large subunit